MKKTTPLLAIIIAMLTSNLSASSTAEELFVSKCVICHTMNRPDDRSTMVAPPIRGVMFHLRDEIGSDEKILAHIKSFTMHPTEEKAICKSVRRFGVMPSQKDNITKTELDKVAKWLINNINSTKGKGKSSRNKKGQCK